MSLTSICTAVVPPGTKDKYSGSDWAKLSRWYEVGNFLIGIESLIVECTDIHAPIAVSVNVITPGTLAEEIAKTGYHADEINSIAVSGTFDDSDFAFLKDSMTSLLICDLTDLSVSSLPVAYFEKTALYRCLLPQTLTSISDSLFYKSYVKDGITVPSGVTNIGDYAFDDSDVLYGDYNQVIPSRLDSFGKSAFQRCIGLNGKATIPNGMPLVPDGAFFGCTSLTSINIPVSVTEIGEAAFRGSGLKEVNFPESVNSIGASAFHDCASLTSINIPVSVTEIGEAAFRGSGLKEVNIPESVSSIGRSAFYDCDSLTYIFIPKGVTFKGNPLADYNGDYEITELGQYPYLKTLIIKSGMNQDQDERFDFASADSLQVVEVPANMLNEYEDFGSTRLKIDSVTVSCGTLNNKGCAFLTLCRSTLRFINLSEAENTELPDEALAECLRADSIVLPANLERIGCSALRGCMALKSIDIPASVTEIDDNAFENCFSLSSITFGGAEGAQAQAGRAAAPVAQSELCRIGNWAFYNCHQLQHLVIPEGVTEIGDAAFYGCTYLEDLELPSTVTRIGDN
ncbi:MAG: leucine-rich repeat protein [bacterium]|uniref:Leucine-rich repeat protein n=1 Tax=Candidatus Aphodosoma intestinipullorum TaxID=2840674 RepID=A0A940IEM5_9BACT|nr:leucine-rich repeat protein [Candidatus Aphodosoma intestinipullorum]